MGRKLLNNLVTPAVIGMILLFFAMVPGSRCYGQGTKEVDGLRFTVPEDWPVEKRGGVVGPIPIEEYISMKFKNVQTEMDGIKSDLQEKYGALRSDLESLEAGMSKEMKSLQSQTSSVPVVAGADMTGFLSRLEEVEDQFARIDRKLTNKMMDFKSGIEGVNLKLNDLEETLGKIQKQFLKIHEELSAIVEIQERNY